MRGAPYLIKLQDKSGNLKSNYWYIEWWDVATGRNKRQTTGYKIGSQDAQAKTFFAQWMLEKEKPVAKDPNELLIATALEDYWHEHGQHIESASSQKYVDARLKDSLFITLYASQITQGKINEYTRICQKKGLSNGTIRKDLEHLRAALNHEQREQRLLWVPKFKLPNRPNAREHLLSLDDIGNSLDFCKSEHVKNTIVLMLNTGQRPGVIEHLTWFQVDFKERVINFSAPGGRITNKRVRPVRMNEVVYELLLRLYEIRTTEFVIEQVFRNKKGQVTKTRPAGNIKKGIKAVFKRMGIDKKGMGRYTLRHTFANLCEADDKTRSDIMGHTDTETTQWHYLKANKQKQQAAMDQVGELFQTTQKLRNSENRGFENLSQTPGLAGRSERI